MKKLKIDSTFVVALVLLIGGGIYLASLSVENKQYKYALTQMEKTINDQQRILEQYETNYLELFKHLSAEVTGFYRFENGKFTQVSELPRQKIILYSPALKEIKGGEKLKLLQYVLQDVPLNTLCIVTDKNSAPEIRQVLNQPLSDVFFPVDESVMEKKYGEDTAFLVSTPAGLTGYLKVNEFNRFFIQKYLKYISKLIY